MAINLDERYPGRANPKTLDYPQGSFKNRTSPTAKDGTFLEQDWANDQLAFFQSLIKVAGMTADGAVDTVEASQYFNALQAIIDEATPGATEVIKGLIEIATTAEAQALTDDARALTPKKLADAFTSGVSRVTFLPDGNMLMGVSVASIPPGGSVSIIFPIAFSATPQLGAVAGGSTTDTGGPIRVQPLSSEGMTVKNYGSGGNIHVQALVYGPR